MYKYIIAVPLSVAFAVSALYVPFGVNRVHAEHLITDEQVQSQYRSVLVELVDVLREDVTLLQMLLLQKLEARLAELQAQQT